MAQAGDELGGRGHPAENALRNIVIGRKTWLFARSDKDWRTAATLCSFIASCQRHAIDPFAYLRDLLARISACQINSLGQFLHDRWRSPADQDTPMVWDSPIAAVQ